MKLNIVASAILFFPLGLTVAVKAENIAKFQAIKTTNECGISSLNCKYITNPIQPIINNRKNPHLLAQTDLREMMNSALKYAQAENYPKAIEILQQMYQLAQQGGDLLMQWYAIDKLGYVYMQKGDFQKMRELHEQNLAFAQQHNELKDTFVPFSLEHLSWAYTAEGNYSKAVELIKQAIANTNNQEPILKAYRLNTLGVNLFRSGNMVEAEKTLYSALELYETALKQNLETGGSLIPQQYKETIEVIRQLQQVLIAQNKIEPALELSEKGRSRAFVALLAGRITNNSGLKPDITSPTIAQIKQIAKATNSTLVTYSVIYDFQPYKTIRVQDQDLSNIPAKNLLIWVIKPTGKIAFKQVNLDQKQSLLAEQVQLARESIGASGRGLAAVARTQPDSRSLNNDSLKQLHQLLIAPIADQLPTDPNARITFIPQDTLFLVPFVALQDSAGKYLVEKHTILTSPSIQVLDLTHQQQQRIQDSAKGILIVGNPTMPSFSTQGSTPEQLPSLPGAEKEALAIAKLFNSEAIIGNQATKLTVEQRISQARIVHLATHGLLDNTEGIFSSLALAPGNGDNGFLTAREIIALKLNAELVVLSACDTGKGKISGGDGVVGLSRSFIGAGTPSIIVSLWSVPDAPTAELMSAFYQNLKNGLDKVQSLRSAMLQTMKQFPNPRDWGAFTLIGEADTSKTLQAAIGGSPVASVSNNNSNNSSTNQDSSVQATRYTVFPVPNVFKGYRESPSDTVSGEIDVMFQSTLSVQELYNFYRQAFSQKGLKERASLSSFNDRGFQLVFDGSANGHPIIIQVNDVPGFDRTVSIRFDN